MRETYDITGKQYRNEQRARRYERTEPKAREYMIPLIIGTALFIVIGCLIDPTSMFTLR